MTVDRRRGSQAQDAREKLMLLNMRYLELSKRTFAQQCGEVGESEQEIERILQLPLPELREEIQRRERERGR